MEWNKRPGLKKGLKIAGYVLFGLVVFVLSLAWTFPKSRLKVLIEHGLQRAGYQARIERASLTGLGGLSLEGVAVVVPSQGEQEGQQGKGEREIRVDKMKVGFSILPLLFKKVKAFVSIFNGGGVLGPIKVSMARERLDVVISRVENFALPSGIGFSGISLKGVLEGKGGGFSLNVKEGLASGVGRLDLVAKDVVALKPILRHKTHGSLELSDVKLGVVRLSLVLDKRSNIQALKKERKVGPKDETVIHFEKAEVDGEDIKVVVDGQSTIRIIEGRPLLDAQLNVELAFSLSDAFFEREVKSEGGSTTKPNKAIKTLLELDPGFRAANVGGYYGLICTGTLRAPSCIPKRPSIRGGNFKPPEKPEDKGEQEEKKAGKQKVTSQPVHQGASAQRQLEVQTPTRPVSTPQTPAPSEPPTPLTQEKPVEPVIQQVPPREIPTVERPVTLPQRLVPTIIGRPKFLIRGGGGEAEEGEGQEQMEPEPANEPAPTQE